MNENMKEKEDRMRRMESFTNPADLMEYLEDCERESACILEAQERRPLRKDDQLFRQSFLYEGAVHVYSIVNRADGSIEFWLKRYDDDDVGELVDYDEVTHTAYHEVDTSHRGFTLVTILNRKEN